jgi:hypothetical protein
MRCPANHAAARWSIHVSPKTSMVISQVISTWPVRAGLAGLIREPNRVRSCLKSRWGVLLLGRLEAARPDRKFVFGAGGR